MEKYFIIILSCVLWWNCSNPATNNPTGYPSVITGRVTNKSGGSIVGAKVTLPTDSLFKGTTTDDLGIFTCEGFSPGQHHIRIERYGYEIFEAKVPSPQNDISTINPVLQQKTYVIPEIKPMSTGRVRIQGRNLETDFDGDGSYTPFVVKGAAFSPSPIGNKPITQSIYDRSILKLTTMNANTVRTYSGVDSYFLAEAAKNGIRAIVGYWVDLTLDLSRSDVRNQVLSDFSEFVFNLKDSPGVLMWNIGNEQNYSSTENNGNSGYWYSLVEEMAVAAYKVEGSTYHPVCISNGGLYNVGDAAKSADDSSLRYVDMWGSNEYTMDFTPFFAEFKVKSNKPIVITEYGIDAWDHKSNTVYESTQATFDSTNWAQIGHASDVCVGATVFEFTDEWWKSGNPSSHDIDGYATNAHPDGYSDEEWWGIIAVTPDTNNDGLDEWKERQAYYMFQRQWK